MSLENFYWDSITFWPKIKIPCVIKRLKYCLGTIPCINIGVMWFCFAHSFTAHLGNIVFYAVASCLYVYNHWLTFYVYYLCFCNGLAIILFKFCLEMYFHESYLLECAIDKTQRA